MRDDRCPVSVRTKKSVSRSHQVAAALSPNEPTKSSGGAPRRGCAFFLCPLALSTAFPVAAPRAADRMPTLAMRTLMSITLANAVRGLRVPTSTGIRFASTGNAEISRVKRARMVAAAPAESRFITGEEGNNVTPYIANLVGRNLHQQADHPLGIIKDKIEGYFAKLDGPTFEICDNMDPFVNGQECFDDLLIPTDHPGRKPSDTYYVSRLGGRELSSPEDTLLRTHTSAHQSTLMRQGKEAFLCTGDVYRRDEIDASHFPVFHQMEGVKLFDPESVGGKMSREEWLESDGCKLIADDLKKTLEGLVDELFGPVEKQWRDDYFPFTEPSFELDIYYNGDWMEVLGCGVVHSGVLKNVDLEDRHGWAFGLGLERLAMVLFSIPDIRLFWTDDKRFTKQFKAGEITTFKPYSKYPPCFKDISFWIPRTSSQTTSSRLDVACAANLWRRWSLSMSSPTPRKARPPTATALPTVRWTALSPMRR